MFSSRVSKKIRSSINQMRLGKIQQVIRGQTEDKRREGKKQKIILSISAHKYCILKDILFFPFSFRLTTLAQLM